MKIPFSEKAIGLHQSINKPIGEYPNKSESGLLGIIKQQEDALHDEKLEVYKLRERVADLETIYRSQKRYAWKLEETVENCKYQINLLTKALTKEE